MSFSWLAVFCVLSVAAASRQVLPREGQDQTAKELSTSTEEPFLMVSKGSGESAENYEDKEQECRWTMYQGPQHRMTLFSSDSGSLHNVIACKNVKGMFGYLSRDGMTCRYVNGTQIDSSEKFMVLTGCRDVLFYNSFDPRNYREQGIVASRELQNYICRAFDTDCFVLGFIEKSTNICFAKCFKHNAICSHHTFQYLIMDDTAKPSKIKKTPLRNDKNIDNKFTRDSFQKYCIEIQAIMPAHIQVRIRENKKKIFNF